jgi:hypothetical protein
LDGILGTYNIEVLDFDNNVLATHSFTDAITFSCSPNPTTVGTTVTCSATGVGGGDRPAHFEWFVSTLQHSSATGSCNLGNCNDNYAPGSTGTWTVKLVKDLDSSIRSTTTFTVNPASAVCGNNVVETGEQCDGGACCNSDCTFTSSSTVCRASASVCDVAEYCDGTNNDCPANQFQSSGTSCSDGLYCNGAETCDGSGNCQAGTAVSCTGNNIFGIATCDNNPDAYHPTWDYRTAFTSTCSEGTSGAICSTGSKTIIHTCSKSSCGAQCDGTGIECQPNIVSNNCYYGGNCNTDPTACTCSYASNEYCPVAGTVTSEICYYGTQSCTASGCGLSTKAMDNYDKCDPVLGPIDTIPPTIDSHLDVTAEATSASGATVTYTSPATHDAVDGDSTATCLPASGSTFALGDTTVTCNAQDAAGNDATPTTFVVHVVDTTPPTVGISGAPADWTNVDQTATVTCSDTASGCDSNTYKIKIFSSDPTDCPTDYSQYTLTDLQTISSHSWVCGAAKDNANNPGYSSPVEFKVDEIAPTITDDYVNDNIWINTATGTITLSPADTGDSGLKADPNAVKYCTGLGCDPSTGTTLSSPYQLSFSTEQNTIVRYQSYDNAGSSSTVGEFIVKIDLTAPSGGSITYIDGYYTSASVPITYDTGTDTNSGLNTASGKIQRSSATLSGGVCGSFGSFSDLVTEFDGSYTDTSVASGNCYKYQYVIADNVGNSATYTSANIAKVDTIAPTTSDDASTTWRSTDATVTLTPSDTGGSELANTYYCIYNSGSPACTPSTSGISVSVTCAADSVCQKIVRYYSTDNAGNIETAHDSATIQIDKTKPETTLIIGTPKSGSNPTYVSTGTEFTLTATDTGSDVASTEYQFDSDSGSWTNYVGAFTAPSLGSHTIYYRSTDNVGNVEVAKSVDINVGATSLKLLKVQIPSGTTPNQYSDPTTVSAILTDLATGNPIPGESISFTIGTQSTSPNPTTDGYGIATSSITLTQPSGSYTVSASFAGVTNYQSSTDSKSFTINKENVAITYTTDLFFTTAGLTITAAPIPLSAHLDREADNYPGDITLAKVTFVLTPTGGGSAITVDNIPVSASGDALTTKNVPVGDYAVQVIISSGNLYWIQNPAGAGTLHVEAGTNEQRVTGGGWISDPESANGKDNFGFTVNYNKNAAPKGNFLFMFRGTDGYNYQVKSNSWSQGGLSFTGTNTAFFTGKCTIQKIDRATGTVVDSWGNYRFTVDIFDGGQGKSITPDTFALKVWDSVSGTIWKQIGTSALGGGNIVVHSK